jgi:hypothetical protein
MPCAGTTPDVATAPDGMKLIDAANVAIYWNTPAKRAVGIGLKVLPFGHHLIYFVPDGFIYQRCYVVRSTMYCRLRTIAPPIRAEIPLS